MSNWYFACASDELVKDKPKGVKIEGVPMVIVRKDDGVFAIFGICSHSHVFLMKGYVDGHTLECPIHEGVFDLKNGKCLAAPPKRDLDSYETREVDGRIEISLDDDQISRGVYYANPRRLAEERPGAQS